MTGGAESVSGNGNGKEDAGVKDAREETLREVERQEELKRQREAEGKG